MIAIKKVSWTEFKNIVNSKALKIQCEEASSDYYLYALDGNFAYQYILKKDGDADQLDFENNYKSNTNQPIAQGIKTQYKSDIVDVNESEQEINLEGIYTEFTIMNFDGEPVFVKLNSSLNDEILLNGGKLGRDIIGADNFALTKIYHKTVNAGKVSKIFYLVLK